MKQHFFLYKKENNGIEVGMCTTCGFVHQTNPPAQEEITSYYSNDQFYKTHSPKNWFDNEADEFLQGLWDASYSYQKWLLRTGNSYLPTVYDIGAGIGAFAVGSSFVYGIEPSFSARERYLSCNPVYATAEEAVMDMKQRYVSDSIRLSLVLEHILDPYSFLFDMKSKFLGIFGKALIIVPNEMNPLQRKMEERVGYPWWISKVHINYFSRESIVRTCKYALMRDVLYQTGTFPMELFYLAGYDYITKPEVGMACHKRRLNFEKKFGRSAYNLYHILYNKCGWGRESITVYGYQEN